jgi:hypothetical protein
VHEIRIPIDVLGSLIPFSDEDPPLLIRICYDEGTTFLSTWHPSCDGAVVSAKWIVLPSSYAALSHILVRTTRPDWSDQPLSGTAEFKGFRDKLIGEEKETTFWSFGNPLAARTMIVKTPRSRRTYQAVVPTLDESMSDVRAFAEFVVWTARCQRIERLMVPGVTLDQLFALETEANQMGREGVLVGLERHHHLAPWSVEEVDASHYSKESVESIPSTEPST